MGGIIDFECKISSDLKETRLWFKSAALERLFKAWAERDVARGTISDAVVERRGLSNIRDSVRLYNIRNHPAECPGYWGDVAYGPFDGSNFNVRFLGLEGVEHGVTITLTVPLGNTAACRLAEALKATVAELLREFSRPYEYRVTITRKEIKELTDASQA